MQLNRQLKKKLLAFQSYEKQSLRGPCAVHVYSLLTSLVQQFSRIPAPPFNIRWRSGLNDLCLAVLHNKPLFFHIWYEL